MSEHVAVRTCVGCGRRDRQAGLVRFAAVDGRLVPRRPHGAGRSAYLHRTAACWDGFLRRRGPVRSLRATLPSGERERFVAALRAAEASR